MMMAVVVVVVVVWWRQREQRGQQLTSLVQSVLVTYRESRRFV